MAGSARPVGTSEANNDNWHSEKINSIGSGTNYKRAIMFKKITMS